MGYTTTSSDSIPTNKTCALWRDKLLLGILLLGALIRLAFLLVGAKVYYGPAQEFLNGDSSSYMMSFENLLKHGTYTFDFMEPLAAFGRLPGYPFFYGLHYLVFGPKYAVHAVACTQALLDCGSILLVFLSARKLSPSNNRPAPYLAAGLYATYPFIIVWSTIIGTELFATFLTLLWLYTLLSAKKHWGYYVIVGIEVALMFYTREFLGVFIAITGFYLVFSLRDTWAVAVRHCVFVGLGFLSLYSWWPARNYVFQHQIVLVKPERAGFANYKEDMVGFLNWVHSWSNESTYWLQQALTNPRPPFPDDIFASPKERTQAYALLKQADECGSSFYFYKNTVWMQHASVDAIRNNKDYMVECNAEIAQGFEQLRTSYRQRHPLQYYLRVPFQNILKVFFKSTTQDSQGVSKKQLILSLVFGYRTLLLVLGLIGAIVYRRIPGIQPILVYWCFIVVFLCFYYRQLEMRYLIQADVLLLLPAALLVGNWLAGYFPAVGAQSKTVSPAATIPV